MSEIKKSFMENVRTLVLSAAVFLGIVGLNFWPSHAQLGGTQTWLGTGTVVAGGSSSTLTVAIHNIAALNDILGVPLRFLPSAQSVGPVSITINLDSGGTLSGTLSRPTSNIGLQALSNAELQTSVIAEMTYDGSVFELKTVDLTPIGHIVEFRGGTAPLGSLVEDGTCYSQTQYAALFSVIGTTYNANAPVGCSGGQFAVPYSNGTVFNASDTQGSHTASRITTASCPTPGTVGTLCGGQTQTLTTPQLPTFTPTFTAGSVFIVTSTSGASAQSGSGSAPAVPTGNLTSATMNSIGSGSAHPILNTTIIGIRAIKY